jgi:hypothetical protein
MPAKKFKKGMKKEEKNKVISSNIREEKKKHPEMPIKQAIAIAYSEAEAKKPAKKKKK